MLVAITVAVRVALGAGGVAEAAVVALGWDSVGECVAVAVDIGVEVAVGVEGGVGVVVPGHGGCIMNTTCNPAWGSVEQANSVP